MPAGNEPAASLSATEIFTLTRERIVTLQHALNNRGYGPLAVDGIYGGATRQAYARLLQNSDALGVGTAAPVPAAAIPWWVSRAVLGSLSGLLVGGLALLGWTLDGEQLTNLLLAIAGLASAGLSFYGSVTRAAPIDPTLVLPGLRSGSAELPKPKK